MRRWCWLAIAIAGTISGCAEDKGELAINAANQNNQQILELRREIVSNTSQIDNYHEEILSLKNQVENLTQELSAAQQKLNRICIIVKEHGSLDMYPSDVGCGDAQ